MFCFFKVLGACSTSEKSFGAHGIGGQDSISLISVKGSEGSLFYYM
jgi:hypothetical protein